MKEIHKILRLVPVPVKDGDLTVYQLVVICDNDTAYYLQYRLRTRAPYSVQESDYIFKYAEQPVYLRIWGSTHKRHPGICAEIIQLRRIKNRCGSGMIRRTFTTKPLSEAIPEIAEALL